MDLMTLAAKIVLDDSGYQKGIQSVEKSGKNLAGKMSAMTVAVGNIAADMIKKGASAISGVMKDAVGGFADYQQLVGGVETLFKASASKIQSYAKQSYKTTGLSANAYMETVTSFSASLLQGLHGDTEKAADIANTAITDMADNANKMGTDISSIQAAYQGFAKQNYTMLDNLKLGYGGTQSEMVRLINDSGILEKEIKDLDGITFDQMIQAIHKVQTEMGITGTTAEEAAATISGSRMSLEAAWEDFLTSVGGGTNQKKLEEAGGRFKATFETYVKDNLLPAISTTLENTPELIEAIGDAITSLPEKALGDLAEKGVNILTAGVETATDVGTWLLNGIIDIFKDASIDNSKVTDLGTAIGDFIGSAVGTIVTNAGTIFEGIVAIGTGLASGIVEGLKKGLFGEGNEVDAIKEQLDTELTEVDYNTTKASALLQYLQTLYEEEGNAVKFTDAWKQAVADLDEVLPGAGEVFDKYGSHVQEALNKLNNMNQAMRTTAIMSALQKATADEWELYTAQNVEFNRQKNRYAENQNTRDYIAKPIMDALAKEAQKRKDVLDARRANGEFVGREEYGQVNNILKGFVEINGQLKSLQDLDLSELQTQLKNLFPGIMPEEYNFNEYIEKNKVLFAEATNEVKSAKTEMERVHGEMEATFDTIKETEKAVMQAKEELGIKAIELETSGETAAEAIEDSGAEFAAKLREIKDMLPGSTRAEKMDEAVQAAFAATAEMKRDNLIQELMDRAGQQYAASEKYGYVTDRSEKQKNLAEGLWKVGDELKSLGDLNLEQLKEAVKFIGGENIWDSYDAAVEAAAKSMETSGADVAAALADQAAAVRSIQFPSVFGGPGGESGMGEATGIDSVPYNGFRASLHRGEMILTKREAESYRNGGGTAEIVGAIQSLQADMQNLKIVVGQKTFGRAVVNYGGRRTQDYIGDSESRYSSGYGT